MNYGIQLYGLRDIASKDMEAALRAVAELGYSSVEFAGFFGHSAQTVKSWLEKYGLTVSGTHTSWKEVAQSFDETTAYHMALGNKLIIVPGADLSTQEKIDDFVAMANEFRPKLEDLGIRFAYHNHDHEFKPNQDGSIIYDQIVERTSLLLELDTYWSYAAGKDPVAQMEQLRDRLVAIHIKDGFADGKGKPLGLGTAPVKEVHANAVRLGLPIVVESETQNPDGITESKICIEYLKSLK